MANPPRLRISREDFLRIGAELFGDDARKWRFRCVQCGHEQSRDEAKARDPNIGEVSGWIYFSCEGRRNPNVGCGWTLGGLFQIHTLEVVNDRGEIVPSFEFAHDRGRELCAAAAAKFSVGTIRAEEARAT